MSIDFGTDIYEEPIVAKTFLSEDVQEGSLRLGTLPSGKWRHLSAQEVQELCK